MSGPDTVLGNSVSQFDTSTKPEGYWSSSQVGGLVHKVFVLVTNLLRSLNILPQPILIRNGG